MSDPEGWDDELEALLRDPFEGLPELERLGIFSRGIDHHPPVEEVTARLRELERAPEPYVDDRGCEWQVTALAIDDAAGRAAWVEWQERGGRIVDAHYWLKARDAEGLAVEWEIETYNPYFGCRVEYLAWHAGAVVLVYADKHDTFAATAGRGGAVRRTLIAPCWSIEGDALAYPSETAGVKRLHLPTLDPL